MDTTPKIEPAVLEEPLLPEPVKPEIWECCGSECGDACIQTIYYREKAAYDAQQKRLKALAEQEQEAE
ncbi:MAG: hypothetical protein Q4A84_01125 [Neisseria sp.]|uniref:hypothetical protein n=1 Tax=Neisseria sp. TaxID=192066 RepID=UPI0026DC5EEA|nr:hypothetical protein [Neisseria sp.]MDO4640295.1 hypothetical protein [Neisseria sp.]